MRCSRRCASGITTAPPATGCSSTCAAASRPTSFASPTIRCSAPSTETEDARGAGWATSSARARCRCGFDAEVIGTAPIERFDVLHGTKVVKTVRPYSAADLGRRVRVLWEGAEYRGRGRETIWQGKLTLSGNRFSRFAEVNFLNPERKVQETASGTALAWTSVTTGNLAGIDLWLDEAKQRHAQDRNQCRLGRNRPRLARRQHRRVRRWHAGPQAQRLSACPKTTGAAM